MSQPPTGGPDDTNSQVSDPAHEEAEHVGILGQGTNVFYHPERSTFYRTEHDAERDEHTVVPESERELQPEETLGEAIEEIGDRTGWESLSEWAEEHLTDDE